jgi:threonine/homoserine/homoserine lactone efflux protein
VPDLPTYLASIGVLLAYQLGGVGPDMLLVISRGVARGRRVAVATALGCVAAGIVQVPLLALGLASLFTSSVVAYEVLRWLGAAYLVYLGLSLLLARCGKERPSAAQPSDTAPWAGFWQGMITNLTNPATLVFMLAVLPQFAHPSAGSVTLQLLVLGATMKGTGVVVLGSVALLSGTAGGWLARRPGFLVWQERLAGSVLIALGVHLLFADSARSR